MLSKIEVAHNASNKVRSTLCKYVAKKFSIVSEVTGLLLVRRFKSLLVPLSLVMSSGLEIREHVRVQSMTSRWFGRYPTLLEKSIIHLEVVYISITIRV